MKTTILTILLCISLAFNLGFVIKVMWPETSTKHPQHADGDKEKEWRTCSDNLNLGLTCDQITQLQAFKKEYMARITPLQHQLKKERAQLLHLLKQEEVQEDALHQVVKNICSLQSDIQKAFIHHFFQLKTIMKPEQAQKFCSYMGECLAGSDSGNCKMQLKKAEQEKQHLNPDDQQKTQKTHDTHDTHN